MATPEEPPKDSPPYYEYMFEANKRPTKQLDALLRAIGKHIVRIMKFLDFPPVMQTACCVESSGEV
jgi:hypothetical protein